MLKKILNYKTMNTPQKDGGPAFPTQNGTRNDPGMSLRDWFAGQALMSMLSTPDTISDSTYPLAALLSYRFADAMLAARNERQEL